MNEKIFKTKMRRDSHAEAKREEPRNIVPRGGRLRKTARGIVTFAPWLGMIMATAMGMGLATGDDALAQQQDACVDLGPDTVECRGAVTGTFERMFGNTQKRNLIITDAPGATFTTSGSAFHIEGLVSGVPQSGSGSTDFDFGNLTIDLSGAITASRTGSGMGADAGHGIYAHLPMSQLSPDQEIRVTVADVTAAGDGLRLRNLNIGAAPGEAPSAAIAVTTTGAIRAAGTGIYVSQANTEERTNKGITITLGGSVAGGVNSAGMDTDTDATNNVAIDMKGGSDGNRKLVLNPGAGRFTGRVRSELDATLELAGASGTPGATSPDLSQLSSFSGFPDFVKTGTGTFYYQGTQGGPA